MHENRTSRWGWKTSLAVVCTLICCAAASAQAPMRGSIGEIVPHRSDSGMLTHSGDSTKVVHTEIIHESNASWLRLFLDGTVLEGSSYLRVLSLRDGEVQYLDQATLQQWRRSTAFFNGNTLLVELIASPGSTNRIVIDELAWDDAERGGDPYCGYCGLDDRTPYDDLSISRLLGGTYTCTGTIVDEESHMISAGHCMSDGSALVAQFDIPPSNIDCTMNHPPVNDQFPITGWLCQVNGPGNDWAAILLGTNGLGERPYDRYGQAKVISTSIPPEGTDVQILGYGDDIDQCEQADTLQESVGSIIGVEPLMLKFSADVTYGSSGSPLMTSGSQRVIGLTTHCPCPNLATRVDQPNFVEARDVLFTGVAGDTCSTALFATIGDNAFSTTGAVDSEFGAPDESQCEDTYLDWDNSPDFWFAWQPASSGILNLSSCDLDSYDTSMVLYGGTDCDSLTQIACNGDSETEADCQSFYSSITDIEVSPLSTYYIRLGGWQGDSGSGTLWIDHIPAPATGACCLLDDQCLQLIQLECTDAGGTYQGPDTDCGSTPCSSVATGACCTGLGASCQTVSEANCINLGGEYLGNDSSCLPNPCALATGACCIGSSCSSLTEAECLNTGGTYSGEGTSCLDLPCVVTCPGDFGLDGEVDVDDLLTIIAWFGSINPDYDLDGDGLVDVDDLLQVIGAYGPC